MKRIIAAIAAAAGVAACATMLVQLASKSAPHAPIVAPTSPIVARPAPVIAPPTKAHKERPRPVVVPRKARTPRYRKIIHRRTPQAPAKAEYAPAAPPFSCPLVRFAVAHFSQTQIAALAKRNAVTPAQAAAARQCLSRG